MLPLAAAGIGTILAFWVALLAWYFRPLRSLWREPVFKCPVLIFESDDWGPAPPDHAGILAAIAALLSEFSDEAGHHPVMTLAVVLAIPEAGRGISSTLSEVTLQEPRFEAIASAMRAGVRTGVFQLQLHGRSHYWPEALLEAAKCDAAVASWLAGSETWRTEALPPELQSRWEPWVEGCLFRIANDTASVAAEHDALLFKECLGIPAKIAVPNRFDWNDAVERGWAKAGIRTVVTPGRHRGYPGRSAHPSSFKLITNGMRSEWVRYVVRDQYFEPYKGHGAEHGLRALAANTALGRPTLLETHRVNFLDAGMRQHSFRVMRELLAAALKTHPGLRFLSTAEVVHAIDTADTSLIDRSFQARIAAWYARIRTQYRFWKLARLSGLGGVITAGATLARSTGRHAATNHGNTAVH